jgi:crossover junction endodeoxyribonuclease RusA
VNITIKGRIPSKKNCKMALPIKGRCMVVNSGAYTKWKKDAGQQVQETLRKWKFWDDVPLQKVAIKMFFYAPDRRKTDLTNKAESIMDLLVDEGILKDDCCEVVPFLTLLFMGVEKDNPRMEVQIERDI